MIAAGALKLTAVFLPLLGYGVLLLLIWRGANDSVEILAGLLAFALICVSVVGLFFSLIVLGGPSGENSHLRGWHADPHAWQRTAQFGAAGVGFLATAFAFAWICARRREEAFGAAVLATVAWTFCLTINLWNP